MTLYGRHHRGRTGVATPQEAVSADLRAEQEPGGRMDQQDGNEGERGEG